MLSRTSYDFVHRTHEIEFQRNTFTWQKFVSACRRFELLLCSPTHGPDPELAGHAHTTRREPSSKGLCNHTKQDVSHMI